VIQSIRHFDDIAPSVIDHLYGLIKRIGNAGHLPIWVIGELAYFTQGILYLNRITFSVIRNRARFVQRIGNCSRQIEGGFIAVFSYTSIRFLRLSN
jgi:hypothetical protein